MAYGTEVMVKIRIGLEASDDSSDALISTALTYADARINAVLKAEGGSDTIASAPQEIMESCADLAAYFIYRVNNPTTATLYLESALTLLNAYIIANLKAGGALITGKEGLHDLPRRP